MISERKIHDPISALMRHVFFPIQPSPAVLRVDALLHGPGVDVGARLETAPRARAQPVDQRVEPSPMTTW